MFWSFNTSVKEPSILGPNVTLQVHCGQSLRFCFWMTSRCLACQHDIWKYNIYIYIFLPEAVLYDALMGSSDKCLCLPAKQASYELVIQGSIIWFFGNNVSLWWATLERMEEGFWAKMTIMLNNFSLELPPLCARFWVPFPEESLQFLHPKVSFLQFFHQAWFFLHISDKNQVKIRISGNIDVVFLCGH